MEPPMTPEELKPNDLKTKVECDHTYWGTVPHPTNNYEVLEFTYCPKCGERLSSFLVDL